MRTIARGFTMIELMMVVAILGIIASVAVPNFARYQARAKASELKENVAAIFRSEESYKNRDNAGQYLSTNLGTIPAGCVPGTVRHPWAPGDHSNTMKIDWIVEGGTYGCYHVATSAPAAVHLTAWAETDLDGDGWFNCIYLFKATLASNGVPTTAAAGVPAPCQVLTVPFAAPWGEPKAVLDSLL